MNKLFTITSVVLLVFSIALNVFFFLNKKTPVFSTKDAVKLSRNFEKLSPKEQDNKILSLVGKGKTIFSLSNSNASYCSDNLAYARIYYGRMVEIVTRYVSSEGEFDPESVSERDFALLDAYSSALNEMIDRLDDGDCYD